MRASSELIRMVKREAAGLTTHSEREWLGLDLATIAAGEEVQFVRCDRGTMTGWIEQKPAGTLPALKLTDADRELIRRSGHSETVVLANLPPSAAARREREAMRMNAAETAGALTPGEREEMDRLRSLAVRGELAPGAGGQDRLVSLLDRSLASRGGGR